MLRTGGDEDLVGGARQTTGRQARGDGLAQLAEPRRRVAVAGEVTGEGLRRARDRIGQERIGRGERRDRQVEPAGSVSQLPAPRALTRKPSSRSRS